METFDVIVIGAGAVGENAADRAARTGLAVALVEAELVGGECSYWACMPSKALLRPGAALADAQAAPGVVGGSLDPTAVLARRDEVTAHWHDDGQAQWVAGAGLSLVRGRARFTGPRALTVQGDDGVRELVARHAVVLATGSVPVVPPVPGLAEARPWTSREATSARTVPPRLAVLGGGVVAVEMAQAYAALGSAVTLLVRGSRVLSKAEPFAGEAVVEALSAAGVQVRTGARLAQVHRDEAGVHLVLDRPDGGADRPDGGADRPDGGDDRPDAGAARLDADELLVATGRRPALDGLGLEHLGLPPGAPLQVDDAGQVLAVDGGWLFAVGDVAGRTATTHQGKYDARVVGDVVAARFGGDPRLRAAEAGAGDFSRYRASADLGAVPQVVFTRPEVAWVGRTLARAVDEGLAARAVDYDLANLAGASVLAPDYRGRARFVVDEDARVLLGATFVGPGVAELLHAATVAVVGEVPLDRLWHAVPSYPTLSEVWLRFLEGYGL
ncbi:dihydrolipoyl dehydrogenase family protein [Cellulomonas citrea]|uniref:dihydrolipoyl dehydrogenase family protein n=1 Tax=Cellulomonas citrea TaxID=1909423 RepID=UPI0013586535|nr:NAD(P)/FAD-dependent oxidoreductase [Cellulomonas citrea]